MVIANDTITISNNTNNVGYATTTKKLSEICSNIQVGDTVTLSYVTTSSLPNKNNIYLAGANVLWGNGTSKIITQDMLNSEVAFYGGYNETAVISEFMIEIDSTATSYEQFCGATASPNPEYPQAIKNVVGDVNVKIENKNLAWDGWAEDFVSRINNTNRARIENYDNRNCLFYNASAGYNEYDTKYIFKTNFKDNTAYTFSFDIYTTQTRGNICIAYTDGSVYEPNNITVNSWQKLILSSNPEKTVKYLRTFYRDDSSRIDLDTFMVLEGVYTAETIPSYVPHEEQNLPLTLGTIELNKMDTAQDYFYKENNKWYKHEEILKTVFDGTEEGWNNLYGQSLFSLSKYFDNNPFVVGNGLSNYYKYNSIQSGIDAGTAHGDFALQVSSGQYYHIFFKNTNFITVADFKTWLSTHNTEVYFIRKNSIEIEITDTTLISQLNAIKEAMSYYKQTNIKSTSEEVGPIIDAETIADMNSLLSGVIE